MSQNQTNSTAKKGLIGSRREFFNSLVEDYNDKHNKGWQPDSNEWDAFRQAMMQARYTLYDGKPVATALGNLNEISFLSDNSETEKNKDLWNNSVGREIGETAAKIFGTELKNYSSEDVNDILGGMIENEIGKDNIILDGTTSTKMYNSRDVKKSYDYLDGVDYSKLTPYGQYQLEKMYQKGKDLNKINLIPSFEVEQEYNPEYEALELEDKVYPLSGVKLPIQYKDSEDVTKADEDEYKYFLRTRMQNTYPQNKLDEGVKNGEFIYVKNYTKNDGSKINGFYRKK